MKKRILAILLMGVLFVSVLAACQSSEAPQEDTASAAASTVEGETQTLTVWCWDENFNIPAMETAAQYYKESGHDNFEIIVENTTEEDVKSRLIAAFTSGSNEGLPDIVLIGDSAGKAFMTDYEGMFADLTDQIDYTQFANYKTECFTVNDKVYSVPFDSGSAGLFYRKDILEEAGISEDSLVDATWDDIIEMAITIKEETGKYSFNFLPSTCGFVMMQSALQSTGTWFYDENGEADFVNNAVIRELFEDIKALYEADTIYLADARDAAGIAAVQNGEVAFVQSAIWYAPTLTAVEEGAGMWGYTNIPMLNADGATKYTNIGGSSWVILENGPNKDLAIDFMKEIFAGNLDYYDQVLKEQGVVATYLPASESDAYTEVHEFFEAPIYSDFASWNDSIPSIDYGVNTWPAIDALQANIQDYVEGNTTLDEALQSAQENFDLQVG